MITLICNCAQVQQSTTFLTNLKDWLPLFTSVITVAIAAIVAIITRYQYKVNKDKLRLDLYDKRFAVYQCLKDFLKDAYKNNGVPKAQIHSTYDKIFTSSFLFGDEVSNIFAEILNKNDELVVAESEYKSQLGSFDTVRIKEVTIKKIQEIKEAMEIEHQKIELLFSKYLDFKNVKR